MMDEVANRYALSLFDVGCESHCEDQLLQALKMLSQLFEQDREIIQVLSAPVLTKEEKGAVVERICPPEQNLLLHNFLRVLCDKNRMNCFFDIVQAYETRYNVYHNIQKVVAVTAIALSDVLKEQLRTKLEQMLNKKVQIENQVDRSVLGGVLLKIDNRQIDSTVRSRIEGLRNQIASTIA